jgi:hypothetical protein
MRILFNDFTGKFSLPLFLIALFTISKPVFSQVISTYNTDSTVVITREERFDELVRKQKDQNMANQHMPGFRIQVYFGSIRQKASEVKLDFSSRFPEVPVYLTYQQPNFKVRIGDYRSRIEAQKFLKDLEGLYPTSFIVPDEVKFPPLK